MLTANEGPGGDSRPFSFLGIAPREWSVASVRRRGRRHPRARTAATVDRHGPRRPERWRSLTKEAAPVLIDEVANGRSEIHRYRPAVPELRPAGARNQLLGSVGPGTRRARRRSGALGMASAVPHRIPTPLLPPTPLRRYEGPPSAMASPEGSGRSVAVQPPRRPACRTWSQREPQTGLPAWFGR
jgi:hypothetical protein